ncbi:Zinc finger C2H2 superfamily [Arabidopsis thaliana x Arabidopsis arenosa]|uniref:Zinc finger C2H2 superfamily n=1 Tax=Arabidopsis thaliana x Arabidopsis arenosa TaxID=1240361 RepID=A0A8T2A3L8_9BRAS|nr:Zinc finger C2H2 superfamily [Arabidopsis thaliana x Arabidopsis arenosa]
MEFRYRAIDSNRPPPATDTTPSQSPNPNFPSLSARSMSGKSEDQVREGMIQREIEKEQIRQEIIIAEAARKRELIAEVLQEMAIEKEMAIRRVSDTGMSLEEKLIMWINQKKLPNQNQNQNNNNLFRTKYSYIDSLINTGSYNSLITSPMMQLPQLQQITEATGTSLLESNKEKLIILNRADHIGAKPKADSVGTMQLPQIQQMPEATTGTSVLESNKEKLIVLARADPVGEKRKAEDTQTGLNEDLQMKRQKSKESEAKRMSLESGEIVSSKLPCLGKLGSGKKVESKVRSNYKFWCEICKVGTYCQTVMRDHELGKKHKAAVTQQNEAPEAASTSLSPASVTAPQSEATTVREDANPQGKVDEMSAKETTGKTTEGEKKKNGTFWCKTCNIQTNSELTMRNHTLGKKHMALIEKQQKKLVTVPVRSLNADQGEKESVSIAMDDTKGNVHCLEKS